MFKTNILMRKMVIDIFGKKFIDVKSYEDFENLKEIIDREYLYIFGFSPFSKDYYDRFKAIFKFKKTQELQIDKGVSLDVIWLLKEICDIRPEHIGFFKSKLDENMTSNNNCFFLYAIHRNGIFKWTIDKKYWDLYNCEILLPKSFSENTKFITDPRDLF